MRYFRDIGTKCSLVWHEARIEILVWILGQHGWTENQVGLHAKTLEPFRQPFVCVTSMIIGAHPDIVEPYLYGSNVSVIISSPNTTVVIPQPCCTAAFPKVEDVTPPSIPSGTPKVGQDGGSGDTIPLANVTTSGPNVILFLPFRSRLWSFRSKSI